MTNNLTICWTQDGANYEALWRSSSNSAPTKIVMGDDRMTADTAFRLASEGTAILWNGDFQNARQLLQAIARRIDRPSRKSLKKAASPLSMIDQFNAHRQKQSQRARTLGMLLVPFDGNYDIPLRRAPEVRAACLEAFDSLPKGHPNVPVAESPAFDQQSTGWVAVASLRELLGAIGAYEWRKKGIEIPALAERIYPHYGVFAPVRNEYIALVSGASLPTSPINHAFDIGTGTGVLAAILLTRGVKRVTGTDVDIRALACAKENLERLGYSRSATIISADLFPDGLADLIVCNPPWLPARPSSPLEHAIYDPDSRMLKGFLAGLAEHLSPKGEGWLILSDLAEHLGLRSRQHLMSLIDVGGLVVKERIDIRPQHPKVSDEQDALHLARAAEITSLWRLAVKT